MSADDALFHAAEALGPELFAVVDGGKFDDVGQALASVGLSGQPLYLEGADPGVRAAAGHLVTLADRRDLRAVIEIARPREALVIWSWPSGSMALYRHLRTLNLVEIPNEARSEAEAAGEDVSAMPEYEPVLFRHWDPNVLAELLPLLDDKQRSRFLGASAGLALHAPGYGGVRSLPRARGLNVPSTPGMLRIRPEQADSLDRVREQSFFGRLGGYLRDVANDYVEDMSDAELNREIEKAVFIGDRIGLESEYAHGLWAFLHVITDGETTRSYEIRQHFYKAMQDPEVVLKQILDDVLEQLGKV